MRESKGMRIRVSGMGMRIRVRKSEGMRMREGKGKRIRRTWMRGRVEKGGGGNEGERG